jgi:hypothetical protein
VRELPPRGEFADEVKALVPDELIDEPLAGARTEEEVTGPGGLLRQLTKRLVERAMEVELTDISAMCRIRRRPAGPATRVLGRPQHAAGPVRRRSSRSSSASVSAGSRGSSRHGTLRNCEQDGNREIATR